MLGTRVGWEVSATEAATMAARLDSLPAHPEERDALARLRTIWLKVVALVNSVKTVGEAQLRNAGLRDLFDASSEPIVCNVSNRRRSPTGTSSTG